MDYSYTYPVEMLEYGVCVGLPLVPLVLPGDPVSEIAAWREGALILAETQQGKAGQGGKWRGTQGSLISPSIRAVGWPWDPWISEPLGVRGWPNVSRS